MTSNHLVKYYKLVNYELFSEQYSPANPKAEVDKNGSKFKKKATSQYTEV
jgi:hypothetical protein